MWYGKLIMVALIGTNFASCNTFLYSRTEQFANIKVQFVNASVGWIVGPRLLQTRDHGRTWVALRNEGQGTLRLEDISIGRNRVQFVSPEVGWILGNSAINKTIDGGRTWSVYVLTTGTSQSFGSLFFLSTKVGWVVGDDVYQTVDGGITWQRLGSAPLGVIEKQHRLRVAGTTAIRSPSIWFTSPDHGFMARLDGELYETFDGGRIWKNILSVDRRFEAVYFTNEHYGWISDSEGGVSRTVDGGRTWRTVQAAQSSLHGIYFANENLGWAVGDGSVIVLTKDGGSSWHQAKIQGITKGLPPLGSVSFSDATHGWAVGGLSDPITSEQRLIQSNVVFATEDGGETWRLVNL